MFPTQTSLIPVGVALAKFLMQKGITAFFSNYPYWYLGTTPFRFLTGPVLPLITIFIKNHLPLSYFEIQIYLVLASCVLSALGWAILVQGIKEEKFNLLSFVAYFLIFAVLPYKYLNGLALSEPSSFIAEMLLPFVLILNRKNSILGVTAITLILLISTNVFTILLFGMIVISLADSWEDGHIKKWIKPLKKDLIDLGFGVILSTFYYTPGFWLTILINPSIGGVPGANAILNLIGMGRNMIPIFLAFGVVYFSKRISSKINFLAWAWILVFAFLTLWRALSNIDFWMDWITWFGMIEIGVGILIAGNIKKLRTLLALALPFLATFWVFTSLGQPVLISKNLPPEAESLAKLSEVAGKNLVFTSGTGVFWLNALYDTSEVRGGRDEVSINPDWLKLSYVFREGTDSEAISKGLEKLGVKFVLVNSGDSPDYYHDFKNSGLWGALGNPVWQGNGDTIYSE
jgi:hypothetical protein